jgi:hypothetical protein
MPGLFRLGADAGGGHIRPPHVVPSHHTLRLYRFYRTGNCRQKDLPRPQAGLCIKIKMKEMKNWMFRLARDKYGESGFVRQWANPFSKYSAQNGLFFSNKDFQIETVYGRLYLFI